MYDNNYCGSSVVVAHKSSKLDGILPVCRRGFHSRLTQTTENTEKRNKLKAHREAIRKKIKEEAKQCKNEKAKIETANKAKEKKPLSGKKKKFLDDKKK